MKKLFDGARRFNHHEFRVNQALYQELENNQRPHTLFIGCSDSRIVPSQITGTVAGELFIIRNIANIVPFQRESNEFLATTSALEYALYVLEVRNVLVCGHSNCGGCGAVNRPVDMEPQIPHTHKWLDLVRPAVTRAAERYNHQNPEAFYSLPPDDYARRLEQENILLQLEHLRSYDIVTQREGAGQLHLLGWYYDIGSGTLSNWNVVNQEFVPIR